MGTSVQSFMMYPRLTPNFQSSWLSLSNAGILGMHYEDLAFRVNPSIEGIWGPCSYNGINKYQFSVTWPPSCPPPSILLVPEDSTQQWSLLRITGVTLLEYLETSVSSSWLWAWGRRHTRAGGLWPLHEQAYRTMALWAPSPAEKKMGKKNTKPWTMTLLGNWQGAGH